MSGVRSQNAGIRLSLRCPHPALPSPEPRARSSDEPEAPRASGSSNNGFGTRETGRRRPLLALNAESAGPTCRRCPQRGPKLHKVGLRPIVTGSPARRRHAGLLHVCVADHLDVGRAVGLVVGAAVAVAFGLLVARAEAVVGALVGHAHPARRAVGVISAGRRAAVAALELLEADQPDARVGLVVTVVVIAALPAMPTRSASLPPSSSSSPPQLSTNPSPAKTNKYFINQTSPWLLRQTIGQSGGYFQSVTRR